MSRVEGLIEAPPPKHLGSAIPGLLLCVLVGIALFAGEEMVSWLPAPLLALVGGVVLGRALDASGRVGARFASTYLLRAGIVLLGFRLSLEQLGQVGGQAVLVIVPCFLFGSGVAFFIARRFRLPRSTSLLLAVGTAICGNSAIAAVAPSLEARDDEVAAAVTTITIYGSVALIAFPLIADLVDMSAKAFGMWSGTSINDTSQVLASGFTHSDAAGEWATIVKLARNLFIVPVVAGLLVFGRWFKDGTEDAKRAAGLPWFIVMFVLAAGVASVISLPDGVVTSTADLSKILILAALAGIGVGAASLRLDRRFLVPLAAGSLAGVSLAVFSFVLVSLAT